MSKVSFLNTLFFLLAASALTSCHSKEKVVEESYPNGTPKRECTYEGRGRNRELIHETFYYSDKQVQMTGGYQNGKRDGFWISYYANGKKWSEGFYKNGKNDGKRVTYFESGKVRYIGYYQDDRRVGKWKFYDEAGNLLRELDYSPGQKVQVDTVFTPQ